MSLRVAFFIAALCASMVRQAHAQDQYGVIGTTYACLTVTNLASGSWTAYTSATLKLATTGGAVPSGLYVHELEVISTEGAGGDTIYVCTGPAASCGATTHAPIIQGGASRRVAARGLDGTPTAFALRSLGGTADLQVCAYLRRVP